MRDQLTYHQFPHTQNNCDGSGPHSMGQVRYFKLSSNSGLWLCHRCWVRENAYRRARGWETNDWGTAEALELR